VTVFSKGEKRHHTCPMSERGTNMEPDTAATPKDAAIACVLDAWEGMREVGIMHGTGGPILNADSPLVVALELLRFYGATDE
jgi:hypothetical protein